jgi:putative addiction module killer protein
MSADAAALTLDYYRTRSGKEPVKDWLDSLDTETQARTAARLARVRRGLLGDVEPVGEGVFELKLDFGPGYRIYFGRDGKVLVVLLHAGSKKRQPADIKKAQEHWKDYSGRARK